MNTQSLRSLRPLVLALSTAFSLTSLTASAAEYPVGKPVLKYGMEISAVYLQPIQMEPEGFMRKASLSDIHLETDIRALKNNPNGYATGDWIPALEVKYEIRKQGNKQVIKGDLMPMVASDGPHYGDNIKLLGAGKYQIKFIISPPSSDSSSHFGRHVDKETGY